MIDVLPWPGTLTPLFDLTYPGIPRPQGSMRTFPSGGMAYSKPVVAHRNLAVAAFEAAGVDRVIGGPIAARAVFLFRRPDSHYRPASRRLGRPARAELGPLAPDEHVQDPDLDKLQRLVADALKVGGIIAEDNLITDWSARKAWTHNESHTRITLYRKADPDATVRRHTRIVDPLPGL